ncbi:ImmA/IrrE family metallo-endopeptidase [Rhizobium leguminosarum]|uniref:ImmA/IrrE family metallo-endopeptidase n=1 Tax=Rhizobium leguminosarum TaxID=384 RepID=UPI0024B3978A|nr:ImmA/IrrE family metallo-endopeptidase [Rhizobium leguminosarum]WHO77454.1 ImmA/IrrE family metallo-endopeptidase [Rhizobium leguminosarum]
MVTYKEPMPTRASKANVSSFAEQMARYVNYEPEAPIEILVSKLGGAIAYQNAVGDKPESIVVEPNGSFKIFLPTMTSMGRDKFTVAHELGHFYLHFPMIHKADPAAGMKAYRWVEDNNPDLQRCEWEANWFAASFVMPTDLFRRLYEEGGKSKVVEVLGVSPKAAEVRAGSLGLAA